MQYHIIKPHGHQFVTVLIGDMQHYLILVKNQTQLGSRLRASHYITTRTITMNRDPKISNSSKPENRPGDVIQHQHIKTKNRTLQQHTLIISLAIKKMTSHASPRKRTLIHFNTNKHTRTIKPIMVSSLPYRVEFKRRTRFNKTRVL